VYDRKQVGISYPELEPLMEMNTTILIYAPLFGLLFAGLSLVVVILRVRLDVPFGDGGNAILLRATRAHGNFIEYVPIILLLAALLEWTGFSDFMMHVMLGILLLARISHAVAMFLGTGSGFYKLTRIFGALTTWIILVAESVLLILRAY
jgi:uncharacterized protein